MPSRGNPNVPSKQRRLASRRKAQRKNAAAGKVSKNPRGTARSSVLHPTGGPLAPVSKKKARKMERALNHARARAAEEGLLEEGDVEMGMTDERESSKKMKKKGAAGKDTAAEETMDVDGDIS